MRFIAKNEQETAAIAQKLAKNLKSGDVLCLSGGLGAGKTVFARALIRALSGDSALEVPSPTFTLVQAYDTPAVPLWHFDLYRIEDSAEIYELGWEEALSGAIVVVEWPERLEFLAPANRLEIGFRSLADDANQREITLTPHGGMKERHEFYA